MPDYSQGKIYRLWSSSKGLNYIGSTCQPLRKRLHGHRHHRDFYIRGGKMNFVSSFLVLDEDDHQVELIEDFACNSKEELVSREGYWIRKFREGEGCVNMMVAGRNHKEWVEDNKDEVLRKRKIYREKNREAIAASKSEIITCECGSSLTINHIQRHRRTKKHINAMRE